MEKKKNKNNKKHKRAAANLGNQERKNQE